MSLRARLSEEQKSAMKSGDKARLAAIRMILSRLKDADIAARPKGVEQIPEDEIFSLLRSMVKSRRESVELYRQGGRPELADQEEGEIRVIEEFLPPALDDEALEQLVRDAVAEAGATSLKEMGKVMALLKSRHGAALDMGRANAMLKAQLS